MTHSSGEPADLAGWVTLYDRVNGWAHIIRADSPGSRGYAMLVLDDQVSDPGENFLVHREEESGQDVQVSIRFSEAGPFALHRDFDRLLLGTPALMPADLMRSVWWGHRPLWRTTTRPHAWEPVPDEDVLL